MLNFDFLEKGLGIVSPPHFVYDVSRKIFLMSYSINWPKFHVWLSLLFEILGNICIAIVRFQGFDAIDFEINLIFLIKSFFCMTIFLIKSFYLDNERKFHGEIKNNFYHLKGLLSAKICLSKFAPLKCTNTNHNIPRFCQEYFFSFFLINI